MKEEKFFKKIEKELHLSGILSKYFKDLLSEFYKRYPQYQKDFNVLILAIHNNIENSFDRIMEFYTSPEFSDGYLFQNDMKELQYRLTPRQFHKQIIFRLSFFEKKKLIYKLIKLSKGTKNYLDKINEIRNGIAHRYEKEDERFKYKGENIYTNKKAMFLLIREYAAVLEELMKVEDKLSKIVENKENQ